MRGAMVPASVLRPPGTKPIGGADAATLADMVGRPRPEVAAVAGYVPGKAAEAVAQETGRSDVVKLASNERSAPPEASLVAAMSAAAGTTNRYPDNRAMSLRGRLAADLGVDVDTIAVSSGSVGLLHQITAAYAGPGRDVLFPWRSFELYPIFSQLSGANTTRAVRCTIRTCRSGRSSTSITVAAG